MSLNVSDPALVEVYEDVRDDKTETNWAFFDFADGKPDRLRVAGSGSGGLAEFVSQLKPEVAGWGYLRMNMSNDEYSQRVKFVLVPWCGDSVGVMRKAKLSIQISEVKNILRSFHIEVPASHAQDLTENEIMTRLRRAGGANYDRQSSPLNSTIELILYLEPCFEFKQHVEQFLDQCRSKFGSTTANKYGCHVTMVGFFTVANIHEQTAIQQYIDQALCEFQLPTLTLSPQVDCKSVLVYDSNNCPVHLLLPVTVPKKYLEAMTTLAERCQHVVKLRLKKINHISLAYWDEPEATNEQQQHWEELTNKNLFQQIQNEADDYFASVKKPQSWDIVLYKRVTKGSRVDETHLFEEISRWTST